jgi:peptidyl-prolyl cis-trans isomerase C
MRYTSLVVFALALASTALSSPAWPQTPTPPDAAKPDPVVAKVGPHDIHLSDVSDAAQSLPEQMRQMPPNVLFPMLLDQLIDRDAIVMAARKQGLENDPAVKKDLQRAEDTTLQNALIKRDVGPTITEAAIHARYDATIAGKPGETEVQARHILVASKPEAEKIIAELKGGGDFVTLAKKYSTDPAGANGGDLGFFKKDDMLPEFSAAAFALKPGEYTQEPVQTRYGWHVIEAVARKQADPPTYQEAHDQLRQKMIEEGLHKVIAAARDSLTIVRFNSDGSPLRTTDNAEPPPAAAKN